MKKLAVVALGLAVGFGGVSVAQAKSTKKSSEKTTTETTTTTTTEAPAAQKEGDIVETAASAGSFKTLAKALEVAGLVDTLKGPGPFTVFAPTDEAFAKLPAGALDALLKDKTKLKKVLLNHVVAGKAVTAKEVATLKTAKTAQGGSVDIKSSAEGVMIDKANVTKTDVKASNGVIHVVDSVILPKS